MSASHHVSNNFLPSSSSFIIVLNNRWDPSMVPILRYQFDNKACTQNTCVYFHTDIVTVIYQQACTLPRAVRLHIYNSPPPALPQAGIGSAPPLANPSRASFPGWRSAASAAFPRPTAGSEGALSGSSEGEPSCMPVSSPRLLACGCSRKSPLLAGSGSPVSGSQGGEAPLAGSAESMLPAGIACANSARRQVVLAARGHVLTGGKQEWYNWSKSSRSQAEEGTIALTPGIQQLVLRTLTRQQTSKTRLRTLYHLSWWSITWSGWPGFCG